MVYGFMIATILFVIAVVLGVGDIIHTEVMRRRKKRRQNEH